MTSYNTTNAPEMVTQADRDAAADLLGGAAPDGLREGRQDSLSLVQAFARHRHQSASPSGLVEETTERVRGLIDWLSEDADNLYLLPPALVQRAREAFAAGEGKCGDQGEQLCDACSQPAPYLTQEPGCGGPLPTPSASGEAIDPEWHYIDLFQRLRAAGRKDRDKARVAAEYVAEQVLEATQSPPNAAVREALRHQLRNCPLCKGDRKHESIDDLMRGITPRRIVDCERCAPGWEALSAQPAPVQGVETVIDTCAALADQWDISGNTGSYIRRNFPRGQEGAALHPNTESGRTPVASDKERGT